MTTQGNAIPAWQTDDLADEWIDEEEDDGEGQPPLASEQLPQQTTQSTFNARGSCNFGTTNLTGQNTSHVVEQTTQVGTFVVHSDLPTANLPQTPGFGKAKNGVKDIFSPLQLERMFEPPSPPKASSAPKSSPRQQRLTPAARHRVASRPVKPSKLSQVVGASTLGEEPELGQSVKKPDEIIETDVPNIAAFGEAIPSPTCRFTFSVPRSTQRFPARVDFGTLTSASPATPSKPSNYNSRTRATPYPSLRSQQHLDQQANPNDSRLRLFQFQYDTYTREHLSAIVDSFGVSSPSNVSASRTSAHTVRSNSPAERENVQEDRETFSRLRAAKRLKLTPPHELTPEPTQELGPAAERPRVKKDYIGESKTFMQQIKRARGFSLASGSDGAEQEPAQSAPFSDCTNTQATRAQGARPEHQVPSASSSMSTVNGNSVIWSKSSSLAYRRQAADLMAKIKSDNSLVSQKSEDDGTNIRERSYAPSPETRPTSPVKRRLTEKENRSDPEPDPDPPSYAASIARSHFVPGRRQFDSPFPMKAQDQLHAHQNSQRIVVMPVAIPEVVSPVAADRIRSPNPTFLAPPPTALGSMRFAAQIRSSSINEDLNRLVSSGSTATTATTLTVGSAGSAVKHAGPAQMVRIAPADLPSIPERVNGMIFDRTVGRWVKERGISDRTLPRSSLRRSSQGSPAAMDGFTESEDPFRDIESLRDGESSRSPTPCAQEAGGFALGDVNHNQDGTDGTDDMHVVTSDSDSEFDDTEDAQLSTFTFDRPPTGVVQIMTGEAEDLSGFDDGDATTDSDEEDEVAVADNEPHNEEGDNESFYDHLASLSIREDQPQPEESASAAFARAAAEPWNANPGFIDLNNRPYAAATPCKAPLRPIQPPRSALKSASVTPVSRGTASRGRSVSFSDGRKDGKIVGLHGRRDRGSNASRAAGMPTSASVPSARSKRIMQMLEDLEESLLEDEESLPSPADQNAKQRDSLPDGSPSASTGMAKKTDMVIASPRSFARSQTIRRPGQSSPRRVNTPSRANATFLTECSFGVAHDRLVEVITDVQPFEPYWEELSSVDLSGHRLDSVARLKEFLPKLDSLNLNNNLLSWLSGLPNTLRTLSVASNALTSLTAFGHLQNLENLDISYNDIDSLQQLDCLRHLRELRADGNKISKLDGLQQFDGLLKLSVEGNQVREVDLTGFRWSRLELLNLSNNCLESIRGLDAGPALISVNLDNNFLPVLDQQEDFVDQDSCCAPHLRVLQKLSILRLSGNRLKQLDVSRFPNLRTLYVDNNCLAEGKPGQRGHAQKKNRKRLVGLHRLLKLENFSARNQSAPGMRDSGLQLQSSDVRDIRRLYLSGNPSPLPLGADAQACYNLVYLELAACRLTSLPAELSSLMPNIRALNLNYNFLETDEIARGLTGLRRLRKLTIVGNRMTGTKALVKMLSAMGQNIEMLDFRMNPCTLGWYLPLFVQDKDDGALLQPSEPHKAKHHFPFTSALQPTSGNPAEFFEDFEEVHNRRNDAVPSSSMPGTGRSSECGTRPNTSSPSKSAKNKDKRSHSHWEVLDAQFRRGLPDKAYVGRLAYRGLIMRACPQIKVLDGVRVIEKERRKAEALLRRVLKEVGAGGAVSRAEEQQ